MAVCDAEQIELPGPETHSRIVQARMAIPKRRVGEVRQGCARACPPRTARRNGMWLRSCRYGKAAPQRRGHHRAVP